jgi:hypothetical protein
MVTRCRRRGRWREMSRARRANTSAPMGVFATEAQLRATCAPRREVVFAYALKSGIPKMSKMEFQKSLTRTSGCEDAHYLYLCLTCTHERLISALSNALMVRTGADSGLVRARAVPVAADVVAALRLCVVTCLVAGVTAPPPVSCHIA